MATHIPSQGTEERAEIGVASVVVFWQFYDFNLKIEE